MLCGLLKGTVLGLLLRSNSQLGAALGAASLDDLAAVLGAHTLQEAVNLGTLTLFGLKSLFHDSILHQNCPHRAGMCCGAGTYCFVAEPCRLTVYLIHAGFVNKNFS